MVPDDLYADRLSGLQSLQGADSHAVEVGAGCGSEGRQELTRSGEVEKALQVTPGAIPRPAFPDYFTRLRFTGELIPLSLSAGVCVRRGARGG